MNEGREKFEAPFRLTDTQLQQCPTSVSKPKTNRLSRSFRQSQQPPAPADSPKSQYTDFKSPTQIPRSRYVGGFTAESPHNESEFHHDIVWDATSPSPVQAGKRGKTRSANCSVVDIAEIVSRIAPKHGRPEVIEPTLQQWIGDSAALPCTPAVQIPKPKKKSPRVNDLLKLAQEFDFNMFRQAEEEAEEIHQQSLELLSEDILDFKNGSEDEIPPVPLEASQPAVSGRDSQVSLPLDRHMEDDLDFLFDGPTQHVNRNLSQISIAQSLGAKPAPAPFSQAVSGTDSGLSFAPISSVSMTNTKCNEVGDNFEDDWENDDFLNQSLVFEMTPNPPNFATPKHCSTQRRSCEIQYQQDDAVNIFTSGVARHQPETRQGRSVVSKAEKDNVKHRITFKLEANPNFPVKRILTDTSTNSKSLSGCSTWAAGKDAQQSRFSSRKGLSIETEPQLNWQPHHLNVKSVKSNPQESVFHQRTSVANSRAKYKTCASGSSNTSVTKTTKSYPVKTSQSESISNHKPTEDREVPAPPVPLRNNDFLDDDLDSFFLSDSGWDDQEDDDLLCEMCEDLESQVQSGENFSDKQTLPVGHTINPKPALAPSNVVWDNRNQQTLVKNEQFKHVPTYPQLSSERSGDCVQSFPKNPTSLPSGSGRPAENSFARTYNCTANLKSNTGRESYRHMQASDSSVVKTATNLRGNEIQSTAALSFGNAAVHQSQFTFKRPNNPVTTMNNKVLGKCSAAEIELKKQQAMERRRQRMQATQNLRAPT